MSEQESLATTQLQAFQIRGFAEQIDLNRDYYMRLEELVGGSPTFWSQDDVYFIYHNEHDGKWRISSRWCPATQADMLEDARLGGNRGVAMQNSEDNFFQWVEFSQATHKWVPCELAIWQASADANGKYEQSTWEPMNDAAKNWDPGQDLGAAWDMQAQRSSLPQVVGQQQEPKASLQTAFKPAHLLEKGQEPRRQEGLGTAGGDDKPTYEHTHSGGEARLDLLTAIAPSGSEKGPRLLPAERAKGGGKDKGKDKGCGKDKGKDKGKDIGGGKDKGKSKGGGKDKDKNRLTEELSIWSNNVGKVIGKAAETLKWIQKESSAHVTVQKKDDIPPGSRVHKIWIKGAEAQVNKAKDLIKDLVGDIAASDDNTAAAFWDDKNDWAKKGDGQKDWFTNKERIQEDWQKRKNQAKKAEEEAEIEWMSEAISKPKATTLEKEKDEGEDVFAKLCAEENDEGMDEGEDLFTQLCAELAGSEPKVPPARSDEDFGAQEAAGGTKGQHEKKEKKLKKDKKEKKETKDVPVVDSPEKPKRGTKRKQLAEEPPAAETDPVHAPAPKAQGKAKAKGKGKAQAAGGGKTNATADEAQDNNEAGGGLEEQKNITKLGDKPDAADVEMKDVEKGKDDKESGHKEATQDVASCAEKPKAKAKAKVKSKAKAEETEEERLKREAKAAERELKKQMKGL